MKFEKMDDGALRVTPEVVVCRKSADHKRQRFQHDEGWGDRGFQPVLNSVSAPTTDVQSSP